MAILHKIKYFFILIAIAVSANAQVSTYPVNGVGDERDGHYALTNVTLHIDYNTEIDNATLIIKKGKVVASGTGITIPKDALVIDYEGAHIYPSFIDLDSDYGLPEVKEDRDFDRPPQFESDKKGAYGWNQAIRPEFKAVEKFVAKPKDKYASAMRKAGFGTVLSHHHDGVVRGTGVLVTLGTGRENKIILKKEVSTHLSFSKGSSTQDYPGSLMGTIALIRQTYLDADWYDKQNEKKEVNLSLAAMNEVTELPQIFEANDRLNIFRADKIGDEFGYQYIIKGGGDEYMRLREIKATGASLIVPINFPAAYDVEDPFDAQLVSLADMKHWEMAPANLSFIDKAGIEFAITSAGLKDKGSFLKNMKKAVKYGLSEEAALKGLTYTPAKLINAYDMVGSLENGKIANFIITSGPIFQQKSTIKENWVHGRQYQFKSDDVVDQSGEYELKFRNRTLTVHISGPEDKQNWEYVANDTTKRKINFSRTYKTVSFNFSFPKEKGQVFRFSGMFDGAMKKAVGKGQDAKGEWFGWTMIYKGEVPEKDEEEGDEGGKDDQKEGEEKDKTPEINKDVLFPFSSYGNFKIPEQGSYIIKDATVWTNTDQGRLEGYDVLIKDGKISKVAEEISSGGEVIDANGKHLTVGIIDEHSHIAISKGVNEWTQASSAEVRIGDVINSEDVNIYRQLAGGVTSAQLLHGSANPIGGQSGIIKFRWGMTPEDMKIDYAPGFIKFALGENVKQANWGDKNTVRFPQTRMGVEQTYYNFFTKAQEYEKAKNSGQLYRKDLELETLLEILNKERFITCHSYQQGEINMLMHVADSFNFTLNTFTHILEGYKVADKMKAHGANASSFSDWWAYKYEVIDAIPYNAAIMNAVGVNVAINSDDAEMGRRLNQEAAKSVKYGGMSEEDAWKMVTLNVAEMLHLDDHLGTIEAGKDADLVIWSDNPLSIYARAEKTFVDGILFYDLEEDQKKRDYIKAERARLVQKLITAKKSGANTQKAKPHPKGYSCGIDHADGGH